MKKIKLALVGCSGRMGQQIIKEIENFKNIDLVAAIEKNNSSFLNKKIKGIKVTSDKEIAFEKADTIIDFSTPESTLETLKYAEKLRPSKRNELEIVDLLNKYKSNKKLYAEFIGRGGAWLDTGSIEDFYKTSSFVSAIENRQGLKIACLEEIALNNKWIDKKTIKKAIKFYGKCDYSKYLYKLI